MTRRILIFLSLSTLFLCSCSKVYLKHPGTNPGIHNEAVFSTATKKSLEKANMPFEQLASRKVYVEILSKNPGRIYAHLSPMLQTNGIKTASKIDNAKILLRISEKIGGVNLVRKNYWWWWPVPPMFYNNWSTSSQAKSELLIEFFDLRSGNLIFSKLSSSGREYSDITRDRDFYFLMFKINLEHFWAEE
ncbi:MAG: DUF4136 domain-containing protein [Desulfobacterales bacterium]|nr:DUF4136 domain-containing protein [Desulfobacterales bacterium]